MLGAEGPTAVRAGLHYGSSVAPAWVALLGGLRPHGAVWTQPRRLGEL